jgi:type 1 glutamine amidotransferase/plastocyanin
MSRWLTRLRTAALSVVVAAVAAPAAIATPGAAQVAEPEEPPPPRVLVYSGTQSFRHSSIDHGNPILQRLAAETGAFTVDITEDPAAITADTLSRYDLVVWNSPSGESVDGVGVQPAQTCLDDAVDAVACTSAPFSEAQRRAVVDWSLCGGGSVGIHMAIDAWHDWPEWDELTGWVHLNHFAAGEAEVVVTSDSPIVAPFGADGSTFLLTEEYYTALPGDGPETTPAYEQLLGIGAFTDPLIELAQGALFPDRGPIAWTSSFRGANRVFITNLGHSESTWDLPAYEQHLLAGIAHVAEVRPDPACVAAIGEPPTEPPAGVPPIQGVVVSGPLAASTGDVAGFLPQTLTLPRGSSLTYASVDVPIDGAHVIISEPSGLFRSDGITTGTSAVHGVEELPPGTYPYRCQIHPAMRGTLVIT